MSTPVDLRLERVVAASPERVWEAWTTATGLAGWWWSHWPGTRYSVDLVVGGGYLIEDGDHGVGVRGEYLEIEPPRRLVFTWVWLDDGRPGEVERVEVTFTPEGPATRVALVHTGPWATTEPAENYAQGWAFVLDALERQLASESQRSE